MSEQRIFDYPASQRVNEVRNAFLKPVLLDLRSYFAARTAIDVGCGLGYFSASLRDLGFHVLGLDGRRENAEEASQRYPDIDFRIINVEHPAIRQLGSFDLVFCLGLFYHLENPFQAIRNLHALTGKVMVLESMCLPTMQPFMALLEEGPTEDQGLAHIAFYPSEGCLVKMLYRAGFSHVYSIRRLPEHDDFRATRLKKRSRTMLMASRTPLPLAYLTLAPEPHVVDDPWATAWARAERPLLRAWRFLRKPWREKRRSIGFRWIRMFPHALFPVQLPSGAWWLVRNDVCGRAILDGGFERTESRFVETFLRPGMTVLDVGAHHGFYTLLASRKVGPRGRVIAFEPSPRERKLLLRHLRLNRCKNVSVESFALGSQEAQANFFLVEGGETGCNSLRPPNVNEATKILSVPVRKLDDFFHQQGIRQVDFIKMDVEGAELDVLRGAAQLLQRPPRPVVLCEVQDVRTQPWGYKAREIIEFLRGLGYSWFRPPKDGSWEQVPDEQDQFDGNFVGIPQECLQQLQIPRGTGATAGRGALKDCGAEPAEVGRGASVAGGIARETC